MCEWVCKSACECTCIFNTMDLVRSEGPARPAVGTAVIACGAAGGDEQRAASWSLLRQETADACHLQRHVRRGAERCCVAQEPTQQFAGCLCGDCQDQRRHRSHAELPGPRGPGAHMPA